MPFKSQIHVDTLLTNISIKYRNEEYIWDKVFPKLDVKKRSDLYRVYERNFRLPETSRANKGKSNEHNFNVSTASYILERHALKDYVSAEDEENWDLNSLMADTTEELTDVIQRRMEKKTADLFTTTNWSLNVSLAAAAAWNLDTVASNPIPVVDTAATTIIFNSGHKPNYGIVPREAFIGVKNHQSVLDRIKYTSAEITKTMIAGLFDLDELLTPMSSIDTSAEGQAAAISSIYGDIAFVGFKPNRPGFLIPSAGYMFTKSDQKVRRWRDDERDSQAIEVDVSFLPRIVSSLSGYLIKDVI